MSGRPAGLASLLTAVTLAAACGGGTAPAPTGEATPLLPPRPVAIEYRAGGPWRYAYLRADTLITTLPNGELQQQVVERQLQLRWQVRATPEGLDLTVTIDSARVIGLGGGVGHAMADSARGAVIRARLLPSGAVSLLTPVPTSAVARTFSTNLAWLVPMIPEGTREGASWVDSLGATMQFGMVDLSERTTRTSTGELRGTGSLVTQEGNVTRDGMTPQLRIAGTGLRWGRAELAPGGRLLAVSGRDSVAMYASVEAIGQRVKILQIAGFTLTPLP